MSKQTKEYILQGAIILFWCLLFIWVQFLPVSGETEEPSIKGNPVEYEADPPVMKAQEAWIASDTPELDEIDDAFEFLVEDAFAEFGNQCEEDIRLGVDVYGHRSGWDLSKIKEVITAPGQFASYPNGMEKWAPYVTEEFRQIVANEWSRTDKACGGINVWYFRTGHFSEYGTPWKKVEDHFFSRR